MTGEEADFDWDSTYGDLGGAPSDDTIITDHYSDYLEFLKLYCAASIDDIKYERQSSLIISYSDILSWDPDYADMVLYEPDKAIPYIKSALLSFLIVGNISDKKKTFYNSCTIRFKDFPSPVLIRDLRENYINQFVQIEGLVRSASDVKPRILRSAWRCNRAQCGAINFVDQDTGPITKPDGCVGCNNTTNFTLVPRSCTLTNAQRLVIQERPEGLRGGDLPKDIVVEFTDDMCGITTAGGNVKVSGILRVFPSGSKDSPFFEYILEGSHLEISQKEYEDIELTTQDIEQITLWAQNPDIYNILISSISPDIKGNENIKLAIAFQLFGGITKKKPDGGRLRGDIHVFLITDPSCGKSQMMRYVARLAPRAVMAVGGGSTAAGLTCSAVKSELDGSWTLEAGALVLADKGIAIVDEADKMNPQDRAAIHEALEDGTVTTAKAGICATLQSRCSMLAAANPDKGRFNSFVSVSEQIKLPSSLLSRFDLIFTMSDNAEISRDTDIAEHIIKVHRICSMLEGDMEVSEDELETISPIIPPNMFRKYVAYARQMPPPILSKDADSIIINYYTSLRSKAAKQQKAVPVTARQMEGMIRLAEASAKIRLSNIVTQDDAERAVHMMDACLKGVAYDPETGDIDWDKMANRTSTSKRDKQRIATTVLRELTEDGGITTRDAYLSAMVERRIPADIAEGLLEDLHREAAVTINKGKIRLIG